MSLTFLDVSKADILALNDSFFTGSGHSNPYNSPTSSTEFTPDLKTLIMDGGLSTAVLEWDDLTREEKLREAQDIIDSKLINYVGGLVNGHPFPTIKPEDVLDINIKTTITGAKLWTGTLLLSEIGRFCLVWTHYKYLKSGGQLIESAGYQISEVNVFELLKLENKVEPTKDEAFEFAKDLINTSIDIMAVASNKFKYEYKDEPKPIITVSCGPYGATLCNGSEYTGVYPDPMNTIDELTIFHLRRLEQYKESFKNIDVFAFETIPIGIEALAVTLAMDIVYNKFKNLNLTNIPAYILAFNSKVLNDEITTIKADNGDEESEQIIPMIEKIYKYAKYPPFSIGLNCLKPDDNLSFMCDKLIPLLETFNKDMDHSIFNNSSLYNVLDGSYAPYLSVYPDGGLFWDIVNRTWTGRKLSGKEWAILLKNIVKKRIQHPSVGLIIGGCCNTSFDHINSANEEFLKK